MPTTEYDFPFSFRPLMNLVSEAMFLMRRGSFSWARRPGKPSPRPNFSMLETNSGDSPRETTRIISLAF